MTRPDLITRRAVIAQMEAHRPQVRSEAGSNNLARMFAIYALVSVVIGGLMVAALAQAVETSRTAELRSQEAFSGYRTAGVR